MAAEEEVDLRLRVLGKAAALRDLTEVDAATNKLDKSVDALGVSSEHTARRGFLMNQALFTARRLAYDFTLAVGAAGTAVALLGLKFDTMMEQNTIAFGFLLGSQRAAKVELQTLYDLAAKTPFQFSDLTTAARKFLAFGFTVQQTNRYLTATGDAISAMGGDPELIERIVRAFGQIQAKGRLYAEEVLQLTEAGIPAYKYLQQQLGLTGDQLAKIGKLGIPANVAIEAIVRGMEQLPSQGGFKGASEQLAKSVSGQIATLRDYSSQLFGEIMMGPFNALRTKLPSITALLQKATEAMRENGFRAMVQAFDEGTGAGGKLVMVLDYLTYVGGSLARIVKNAIAPALLVNLKAVAVTLVPVLWVFAHVLDVIADHSEQLAPIIALLTAYYIANKTATIALIIADSRLVAMIVAATTWTYRFIAAQIIERAVILWSRRAIILLTAATWLYCAAARAGTIATLALAASVRTLRMAIFLLGLLVTLPFDVLIGIIAFVVIAIGYLLYRFGILQKVIVFVWDTAKSLYGWFRSHHIDLAQFIPGIGQLLTLQKGAGWLAGHIPGLASGGNVAMGGIARVGENGPETVYLPAGTTVAPSRATTMKRDDWGGILKIFPAPVIIDGRQISEIVFDNQASVFARS